MNGVDVRLLDGGVWVRSGEHALLIDAPAGAAGALGFELRSLDAVLLTSGRARSVGGLIELLEAAALYRDLGDPLDVHVPLGEERGPALADFWVQHWPGRFPLTVDAARPGSTFSVGPITVTTFPVRAGEPRWSDRQVEPRVAIGATVLCADRRIVVLFGAGPDPALERHVRHADVLVVEVGVVPWPNESPRGRSPWRLRFDEALALGQSTVDLWIVGDDGSRTPPARPSGLVRS